MMFGSYIKMGSQGNSVTAEMTVHLKKDFNALK